MLADVAFGERAEHRVGQGVQGDVGVGMADETAVVRDRDPAEHDRGPGAEGMDVVAGADADVAEARAPPRRRAGGRPRRYRRRWSA